MEIDMKEKLPPPLPKDYQKYGKRVLTLKDDIRYAEFWANYEFIDAEEDYQRSVESKMEEPVKCS